MGCGIFSVVRILVAGSDRHIPSKSTPREMQLEHSVMPPTPEHVRVHTPPRSVHTVGLLAFLTSFACMLFGLHFRNLTLDQMFGQEEPYCKTPSSGQDQDGAYNGYLISSSKCFQI